MKNAVVIILVIAVVILAVMLVRQRRPKKIVKLPPPATHTRKDHHNPPRDVMTEECPVSAGVTGKDVCIIPISYLRDMMPGGNQKDYAIEVHPKETLIWIGDNGESIDVQDMSGIDCSNHQQPDPPSNGDQSLIDKQSGAGDIKFVKFSHVTANANNAGYCYKTNIVVNGDTSHPIDPHLFDCSDTGCL